MVIVRLLVFLICALPFAVWRRVRLPHYRGYDIFADDYFEKREAYYDGLHDARPVMAFLSFTLPDFLRSVKYEVENAWDWVKCHTYTRYHVVDLRDPKNGYDWGWIEYDDIILHACFGALVRFVKDGGKFWWPEKELDSDPFYAEMRANSKKLQEELDALHSYWTVLRPSIIKNDGFGEELDAQDQAMLKRLIEIRESLWI